MGKVGHGLRDLLKPGKTDLIQYQRKQDRHDRPERDAQNTETKRIDQRLTENTILKSLYEIIKSYKGTLPDR